jgi:hypothetical protein
MQHLSHTVYRMQIHLPNEQNVYYAEGHEESDFKTTTSRINLMFFFKGESRQYIGIYSIVEMNKELD